MHNAFIKGTGSYAPKNIVKNSFFESVGSSDEWIYKNLGILLGGYLTVKN